jgi:hypothetical protein
MKAFRALIKRYRFLLVTMVAIGILTIVNSADRFQSVKHFRLSARTDALLWVDPPIFVLLGLLTYGYQGKPWLNIWEKARSERDYSYPLSSAPPRRARFTGAFPVAAVFMKKA